MRVSNIPLPQPMKYFVVSEHIRSCHDTYAAVSLVILLSLVLCRWIIWYGFGLGSSF